MNPSARIAFDNPPALLRATPFWSWNNRLDPDQLCRQIDCFKKMGMGGFHMHPRTGLDTEYMGPAYMEAVRRCVEKAKSEGMLAWLYDEDRWPSGAAGGLVTRDTQWRSRHLLFTPHAGGEDATGGSGRQADSMAPAGRDRKGRLLAIYDITLDDHGCLKQYRRVPDASAVRLDTALRWYAYLEISEPSSWFNGQSYVDTLNPRAIQRFIEVTHERYKAEIGAEFGKTVPAIFTDEPQFEPKERLGRANERTALKLPFTDNLPETYQQAYGEDLLEYLPELFWDLPERAASVRRYRYHDHVCERFAQAFADTVGAWCDANNLALTGHLMEEPTLTSQTAALGEAMRHYRAFQIPGIDILCDLMEFTTAKQAQSVAHQYGRPGVLSELYGVTNWSFDFAGHKRQGDWQAALGVLFRVPHLAWVSMAGEAKRDYPASISYQSPWWEEYCVVEDHFARIGALMSRGRPHVRIGVVHPIESFWLCWGPREQTAAEQAERDAAFVDLTQRLLHGFCDFDFICESLLPSQKSTDLAGQFTVGEMAYAVVIVPNLRTIRSTTLARLEAFADAGGTVIFVGEVPMLVDAQPSGAAQALAARCRFLSNAGALLREALRPFCDVQLVDASGRQIDTALHQMRDADGERYLFICNTDRDLAQRGLELRVRGDWRPQRLNTLTGAVAPQAAAYAGGWTCMPCELEAHGSLLLTLEPGRASAADPVPEVIRYTRELARLADPVAVTLSEPNVLVLDSACWKIGAESWSKAMPILEIDRAVGVALGLPPRGGKMVQPWCDRTPLTPLATVRLRLVFSSRIPVEKPQLALEGRDGAEVFLDGRPQAMTPLGYFTDEALQTMRLEPFDAGEHVLEVAFPYHRKTCIECLYLLGDFGVVVHGRHALIVDPVRTLAFGDWLHQGLPFYAGNVTYHCAFTAGEPALALEVPHFKGTLVKASLDGGHGVPLAFAPFRAEFGRIPGEHRLDLTVFGNRVNAFGQLHHALAGGKTDRYWWGPDSWHSQGSFWLDEYQLWPMGLLSAPRLLEAAP